MRIWHKWEVLGEKFCICNHTSTLSTSTIIFLPLHYMSNHLLCPSYQKFIFSATSDATDFDFVLILCLSHRGRKGDNIWQILCISQRKQIFVLKKNRKKRDTGKKGKSTIKATHGSRKSTHTKVSTLMINCPFPLPFLCPCKSHGNIKF